MGTIEEEESLDFSSSVRSQIPSVTTPNQPINEIISSYHNSRQSSKNPSF